METGLLARAFPKANGKHRVGVEDLLERVKGDRERLMDGGSGRTVTIQRESNSNVFLCSDDLSTAHDRP